MSWPDELVQNAREARRYCHGCPAQGVRSQRVHPGYFDFDGAEIMFVGTEPTHDPRWEEHDDHDEYNRSSGREWISVEGQDGKLLQRIVQDSIDIDLQETWVGDSIKCPPEGETSQQRSDEFDHCKHYLAEEIELISPSIIITLGNWAARRVLEVLEEDFGDIQSTIDCGKILPSEPKIIVSPHYDRNYLTMEPRENWGRDWVHYCAYLDPPYNSNLEIVQDALNYQYENL